VPHGAFVENTPIPSQIGERVRDQSQCRQLLALCSGGQDAFRQADFVPAGSTGRLSGAVNLAQIVTSAPRCVVSSPRCRTRRLDA